jgi:hypothetical protein
MICNAKQCGEIGGHGRLRFLSLTVLAAATARQAITDAFSRTFRCLPSMR